MRRITIDPRSEWQSQVEQLGLLWHTTPDGPYWNEAAYYAFTSEQIAEIEQATNDLYAMFIEAGQKVIDSPALMSRFGIPEFCHAVIRQVWDTEPPALNYGRFDLGYDGKSPPKLFEFNADTPTSLLEAAVVQWAWKEEVKPRADQFNSIHERLIDKWRDISPLVPRMHFAHVADAATEDTMTVSYLRDTAREAGIETDGILMSDIGWDEDRRCLVDLDDEPMAAIYKLYPWEWIVHEDFGHQVVGSLDRTIWIEPIWKMIWSNKAILAVLWDLFPNHTNLLEASFVPMAGDHVAKPFLSREGANIALVRQGETLSTPGDYGEEGMIYQSLFDLPGYQGNYPVLGSWIVDGTAAGMGIREDGLITSNTARFVPHVIEA